MKWNTICSASSIIYRASIMELWPRASFQYATAIYPILSMKMDCLRDGHVISENINLLLSTLCWLCHYVAVSVLSFDCFVELHSWNSVKVSLERGMNGSAEEVTVSSSVWYPFMTNLQHSVWEIAEIVTDSFVYVAICRSKLFSSMTRNQKMLSKIKRNIVK